MKVLELTYDNGFKKTFEADVIELEFTPHHIVIYYKKNGVLVEEGCIAKIIHGYCLSDK